MTFKSSRFAARFGGTKAEEQASAFFALRDSDLHTFVFK